MEVKNKFKNAFTLAETLITLTIIGVIAVLVITTLQQRIDIAEKRAKLNVATSLISRSIIQYQAENLCSGNLSWCDEFRSAKDIDNIYDAIFRDKFKSEKICGSLAGKGCFSKTGYKDQNGAVVLDPDNDVAYYKVLLQNEMSFGITVAEPNCPENVCADIIVDFNGPSIPNKLNVDMFKGKITKNKVEFDLEY